MPVSAVILCLFFAAAVLNTTIAQLNRRRGHLFPLSSVLSSFCMARVLSNGVRMLWSSRPHSIHTAIAAQIFTNAGVALIFVINFNFTQRILRAYHPLLGWRRPVRLAFRCLYGSIAANLAMVIAAISYSFYTLDLSKLHIIRHIQLFAVTFNAVLAFLPIPAVLLCLVLPRRGRPIEKFGAGRMRHKLLLLAFASALITIGAGFRAGVAYHIRPVNHPAWFHRRACFYCFNYAIELTVVFAYTLSRFDRRFHIPNGSSAPGHYVNGVGAADKSSVATNLDADEERPRSTPERKGHAKQWGSPFQAELASLESA